MVGDDQFSFPVVSNPVSQLMQSSPLWRISSRVHHHDETEERAGIVLEGYAMETETSSTRQGRDENRGEIADEKIDLLWEDFFCREEKLGIEAQDMEEVEDDASETRKQLCVPGGARIATRGTGGAVVTLVTLLKLIKKMFQLPNDSAHNQLTTSNE